jgi:hypothetical protein
MALGEGGGRMASKKTGTGKKVSKTTKTKTVKKLASKKTGA